MTQRSDIDRARAGANSFFNAQEIRAAAAYESAIRSLLAPSCAWHFSDPFEKMEGAAQYVGNYIAPLLHSFPDLERRNEIVIAGNFNRSTWVASTGHLIGNFENNWLGIPASRQATFIRYSEILGFENDLISKGYVLLDIVGVARQAGLDLVPAGLGAELIAPAPMTQDGIKTASSPESESQKSLKLVEDMIAGLMRYDGMSLASMEQHRFWHPDKMWYGPSGIGTARGFKRYQDYHQKPFLNFVPDRVGGNHVCRIGDGDYVASGGWPSISATSSGAPWIATEFPSGKRLTMRVMDFWRREGNLLKENWVFIDIPNVFKQFGIDVFSSIRR